MQSERDFKQAIENSPTAWVKDSSGNITTLTGREVRENNLSGSIPSSGAIPVYKTKDGWSTSADFSQDIDTSITIDKDSGEITINAPKVVLDDPSFKEVFNPDVLKQFSSAYQRNKDFKLADPFDEGEESKDITIPELVDKYSQHLKDFTAALKSEQDTIFEMAKKVNPIYAMMK